MQHFYVSLLMAISIDSTGHIETTIKVCMTYCIASNLLYMMKFAKKYWDNANMTSQTHLSDFGG